MVGMIGLAADMIPRRLDMLLRGPPLPDAEAQGVAVSDPGVGREQRAAGIEIVQRALVRVILTLQPETHQIQRHRRTRGICQSR